MCAESNLPFTHGHRAGNWYAVAAVLLLVLCFGGCAQKAFPPGGPQDRTPPTVVSVFPDSGAAAVELGSAIVLTFSEKMNRQSVEGAFVLVPRADLESLHWERNSMTLVPAEGLLPGQTYTMLLAAGMKDSRGNRTLKPAVVHFTTGDSLPAGRLEGDLVTGRLQGQGVMVWAFDSEDCPPVLGETIPAGAGQADSKSDFFIGALPTGRTYGLYAHCDVDKNGELDEGDLLVEADSLVTITDEEPVRSSIEIYLVQEDEPGSITGVVVDSARVAAGLVGAPVDTTGLSLDVRGGDSPGARAPREGLRERGLDSEARGSESRPGAASETDSPVSVGVLPAEAPGDSTVAPPDSGASVADTAAVIVDPVAARIARAGSLYFAAPVIVVAVEVADSTNFVQEEVGKGGAFTLGRVSPGTYRLEVFRDLNGDRSANWQTEPVASVDTVTVRPGRTTEMGELILRWPDSILPGELRRKIREGRAPWVPAPQGESR